ncbi:HNH endonuclease [Dickeya dadantii]|uniref:HNH endonuclease n=1 Tax=Dickeya dadantii TaxID=204038 RepID=UPI00149585ED|nr:HNH endonuclease [Dickeya dadantii]NPE55989.1 HNH endonuclease [Dickeya dadantii]NPE68083.1 HNH endonuclease [Dickeya dadantii]
MPRINNPINFCAESLLIIERKLSSPDFNHTKWSDEDLKSLRAEIRSHYRNEQRLECVYCREPISVRAAHAAPIEHIVPKSQYLDFIFEPKNLCIICPDCNEFKGKNEVLFEPIIKGKQRKRYPTASSSFRIVHPHIDDYDAHIIKANRVYIDITTKGHFTIGICKLNRFFHHFGACDEFINDAKLAEANDLFFKRGVVNTEAFIDKDLHVD